MSERLATPLSDALVSWDKRGQEWNQPKMCAHRGRFLAREPPQKCLPGCRFGGAFSFNSMAALLKLVALSRVACELR